MASPLFTNTLPALLAAAAAALLAPPAATAAPGTLTLSPCRLSGVPHDAQCGVLKRPLDPARADGPQIDIHVAVLPAVARNKKPDPVFFFAGGPGQSAIGLAGTLSRQFARLGNRRDLVLVDQRGTGRSAPLMCAEDPPTTPLAEATDTARALRLLRECRVALQQLPHGDLRRYTTTIAMQDIDAVRAALGAPQINAIGGSYGTRAVLEYMRQFPQQVRRAVIDGVAPPDMVLPASFSPDNQAALDGVFAACEADPACQARYPQLRADWQRLLASLPREATLPHPVTLEPQRITITRDTVIGQVRAPLYSPALAAALPLAITQAAAGRFEALAGLAAALQAGGGRRMSMAAGMHFSVVCAEDVPRLGAAGVDAPGADFRNDFARLYREVCADWPRGEVPAGFYTMPPAPAATLVLSGGIDPVTPPRHGARATAALGAKARHVVVPNAGHGVMGMGCMRDVLFRFVDAADDAAALAVDADCAARAPRPPAFQPVQAPLAPPTPPTLPTSQTSPTPSAPPTSTTLTPVKPSASAPAPGSRP